MLDPMKMLKCVVVVQAVMIIALWFGPASQPAMAQIPDSGAQRAQIIQLLTASNDKMDRILAVLQGGKMQVRVAPEAQK